MIDQNLEGEKSDEKKKTYAPNPHTPDIPRTLWDNLMSSWLAPPHSVNLLPNYQCDYLTLGNGSEVLDIKFSHRLL